MVLPICVAGKDIFGIINEEQYAAHYSSMVCELLWYIQSENMFVKWILDWIQT